MKGVKHIQLLHFNHLSLARQSSARRLADFCSISAAPQSFTQIEFLAGLTEASNLFATWLSLETPTHFGKALHGSQAHI